MAFLRTYGRLAVLVYLALSEPLVLIVSAILGPFLRRRLEDASVERGSADPMAPGASDMVPTAVIAIPRIPRDAKAQTTELVMPPAPTGETGRIRVAVPSRARPKLS